MLITNKTVFQFDFSIYSLLKVHYCNRPSVNSFNFEVKRYHRFKKGEVNEVQEIKIILKLFNSVLIIHFFNLIFRKKSISIIRLQLNYKRIFKMAKYFWSLLNSPNLTFQLLFCKRKVNKTV